MLYCTFSDSLRLTNFLQRALLAARIIDRRWQLTGIHHGANGGNGVFYLLPQLRRDGNLTATARCMVINRAVRDDLVSHFFQTQSLCYQLQVIIEALFAYSMLIFNRIDIAIRPEFHHVAFTD